MYEVTCGELRGLFNVISSPWFVFQVVTGRWLIEGYPKVSFAECLCRKSREMFCVIDTFHFGIILLQCK